MIITDDKEFVCDGGLILGLGYLTNMVHKEEKEAKLEKVVTKEQHTYMEANDEASKSSA